MPAAPKPSRLLVGLLALAAGVTVASLYYCQPVLGVLAREFGTTEKAASLLVTATQLGYAASLLLVVPLGDLFERRRLIVLTAFGSALMLVVVGFSPGHISNQTRIFGLSAGLRNRLNSVYMVSYFMGGALGSVLGSWAWAHGGWPWVCWCGAAIGIAGLVPLLMPVHSKKQLIVDG